MRFGKKSFRKRYKNYLLISCVIASCFKRHARKSVMNDTDYDKSTFMFEMVIL